MKDGYYWARWIGEDTEWEVVKVHRGWVSSIGCETSCGVELNLWEFGEKIERPMTDDEIEAMES